MLRKRLCGCGRTSIALSRCWTRAANWASGLDFLLQELNREANTMLSKTSAAAGENSLRITELGLEMKAEIEKAREQVQNLE